MAGVEVGSGYITIEASARGAVRQIQREFATSMPATGDKAGQAVGGGMLGAARKFAGPVAAALAGAGLVSFVSEAIGSASDLNETVSKSGQIFGKNAQEIDTWANGAATAFGLTKGEAIDAAAGFGNLFTQIGFTGSESAKASKNVVQMAADLGSFNNLDTADVNERISAAFRGEYDSLQAVIPNISAARVEQEAMTATGVKNAKQLTAQQKAEAVMAIIRKDGSKAMGDFARTSGGLANQQKILAAQTATLKQRLGTALLPVVTKVVTALNKYMGPALEYAVRAFERAVPAVTAFFSNLKGSNIGAQLAPLKTAFSDIVTYVKGIDGAKIQSLFSQIVTAVTQFGSASSSLGPTLQIAGQGLRFVADHASLLGKALPFLLAGFAAYKTLQLANNTIGRDSAIGFVAQIGSTLALAGANLALARSQRQVQVAAGGALATENATTLSRIRGTIATVASSVAQRVAGAAAKVFAVGQWLVNAALTANPIGLVVVAIAALVGGLIYAYRHSETFRKIVQAAFNGVRIAFRAVGAAAVSVFNYLKGVWPRVKEIITSPARLGALAVLAAWSAIRRHFTAGVQFATTVFRVGWAALKKIITNPIDSAKTAISTILGKTGLQKIFTNAVNAVGTIWDRLKAKAKAPISFIINTVLNDGLIGAFNKIAGFVGAGKIGRISVPGFHAGGWTGPGSKMTPAGVVHADEFVINKSSRRKIEQEHPGFLDQLNGYAGGGLVGGSGRFSPLFAGVLKMAQKLTGHQLAIYQRGFRPATSYSGTSHRGDAVDARVDNKLLRTLRALGVAIWDRTGKGNWAPHMHGVPLPGRGFAGGSAVWQAADYLRGGDGLGGRDNGPRVGVGANVAAFLKAGFNSASDWLKSLLKKPLDKLREIGGSPFAQMAARFPKKIADAMLDKVKGFSGGGFPGAGPAMLAERGPELVTRPGMYNMRGNERVYSAGQTAAMGGGPVIHQHFPTTATPQAAASAAGGRVVLALSGMGI